MIDTHGIRKLATAAVAVIVAAAGMGTVDPACAGHAGSMEGASPPPGPSPNIKMLTGVRFVYHTFTDSRMEECYEHAPYLVADLALVGTHHGVSFEVGYLYRDGEPTLLPAEWNVLSTSLSMWAVPVTVNYLYYITEPGGSRRFAPYVGVGLGTFVGGEKIGAMANTLLKQWEGWTWGLRGSMIGSAVVGANISPWHGFSAVVELRWIQSGRGGNIDLVDEEDEPELDAYVYPIVQRSTYDFTGWSVSVGIRW
jgi:hypothetical protein